MKFMQKKKIYIYELFDGSETLVGIIDIVIKYQLVEVNVFILFLISHYFSKTFQILKRFAFALKKKACKQTN